MFCASPLIVTSLRASSFARALNGISPSRLKSLEVPATLYHESVGKIALWKTLNSRRGHALCKPHIMFPIRSDARSGIARRLCMIGGQLPGPPEGLAANGVLPADEALETVAREQRPAPAAALAAAVAYTDKERL